MRWALVGSVLILAACTGAGATPTTSTTTTSAPTTSTTTSTTSTTTTSTTTTSTTTTTLPPTVLVDGEVAAPDGTPLLGATVSSSTATTTANEDGAFTIELPRGGDDIEVAAFGWATSRFQWIPGEPSMDVVLQPVRAIRVSRYVAMDPELWQGHLKMADDSVVNALVFDTKDETGEVLYDTAVEYAHTIGAVNPVYEPGALLAEARDHGLYTVTRIVAFEDPVRVRSDPDTKLGGAWVNMADPGVWEYYLELATEACELGFDEIQFDYVRFPAGRTADALGGRYTADDRIGAITGFLSEARHRLRPLGCPVAADVFGIAFSSPTDEGIGQRVEEVSATVDVISPMVYPSHYSDGWLGYAVPNDHPGPVVARALDDGGPRLAPGVVVRPWLQAFYYTPAQIIAEIDEAAGRGLGWMLWNAGGYYSSAALPPEP